MGPLRIAGLTGRKIIVDTYGGAAPGSRAFSGKDPSKVDRSAAYTRYVAKISLPPGWRRDAKSSWPGPSAFPDRFRSPSILWTSRLSANQLTQLVDRHFDLSVYGIIRQLDLLAPRYRQTACYGHFGREVFPNTY